MVSEQIVANKISINAAEQDGYIESVTVFQADHAEIKRRIPLELKRGQNHVDVKRLPTCIKEDSIRVDGTGKAIIFDVVYHNPQQPNKKSTLLTPHERDVDDALRNLESLQKEHEVAEEESKFLSSYGQTLDSKSVNVEDVQKFLDVFSPRQIAVAKRIQQLNVKIKEAQNAYDEAQERVYADARGAKRGTKITITVLAEIDGQAEILLTYVVSNASWTPLYDLRASLAKSPDVPSKIALHYRASITQTTGENWPDVALTLSTASPQLGLDLPSLPAWHIGPRPRYSSVPKRASLGFPKLFEAAPTEDDYDDELDEPFNAISFKSARPTSAMITRQAGSVATGVLNASFTISGRSDIPSDEGSHKVVVAILNLDTELEWLCVPRKQESVFLICKIVNSSEYTLLPGETNVFVDDNFVSKSKIEYVTPSDSFKTSLGIDPAVRVTYPPPRAIKHANNQPSFGFLSKNSKQVVDENIQRIVIRNSRPATLSALRVIDHVPVSTYTNFVVNILSPDGLGQLHEDKTDKSKGVEEYKNKERPWVSIQKGVKARWAKPGVGGEGTVEWECEVRPNEEVELELGWEVRRPSGERWSTL